MLPEDEKVHKQCSYDEKDMAAAEALLGRMPEPHQIYSLFRTIVSGLSETGSVTVKLQGRLGERFKHVKHIVVDNNNGDNPYLAV